MIQLVPLSFNKSALALAGTLLSAFSLTLASPVKALTLVTERSALRSNDQYDFGSLGKVLDPFAPPTPDSFLPNSFSATSEKGLELNFQISPSSDSAISPPFIIQTGFLPEAIPTNFADGDFILITGSDQGFFPSPGNPSPITIDFATPVTGAGTQIAVEDTFSFLASVSAFDKEGNLLDSFSLPGTSSVAVDNSAVFLGVVSEEANVSRLVYSSSVPNRAIGINTVSIRSNHTTIPEPATIFSLLIVAVTVLILNPSLKNN
ncbi:MAG: hypothetical protein AB4372_10380 [Xenococcus sp. (in: cyanobacteria)]